jgi:HEAT repeat protein
MPGESVPTLIWSLANDKDWGVKQKAATLLGNLGAAAKSALPYLKPATSPCLESMVATKEQMQESMLCEDLRREAQQAINKIGR